MQTNELWLVLKCYLLQTMILQFIYMYKEGMALNNLQGLICHKTQTNKQIWGNVFGIEKNHRGI